MRSLAQQWWGRQMRRLQEWLMERASLALHQIQLQCLQTMLKKGFPAFEIYSVPSSQLDSMDYRAVQHRLQVEETTQSVKASSTGRSSSTVDTAAALASLSAGGASSSMIGRIGDTLSIGAGKRLFSQVSNGIFSKFS